MKQKELQQNSDLYKVPETKNEGAKTHTINEGIPEVLVEKWERENIKNG